MFTNVLPYIIYNLLIYSDVTKVTNVTKNRPQSQCKIGIKEKHTVFAQCALPALFLLRKELLLLGTLSSASVLQPELVLVRPLVLPH